MNSGDISALIFLLGMPMVLTACWSVVRVVKSNFRTRTPNMADRPELNRLIAQAHARYAAMSPEEKARHDYEQRRSFARGMCPSHSDYADWCKEVDRILPPRPRATAPMMGEELVAIIDAAANRIADEMHSGLRTNLDRRCLVAKVKAECSAILSRLPAAGGQPNNRKEGEANTELFTKPGHDNDRHRSEADRERCPVCYGRGFTPIQPGAHLSVKVDDTTCKMCAGEGTVVRVNAPTQSPQSTPQPTERDRALEELSAQATGGVWRSVDGILPDDDEGNTRSFIRPETSEGWQIAQTCGPRGKENAAFAVALVNAYRAGELVPAIRAMKGSDGGDH